MYFIYETHGLVEIIFKTDFLSVRFHCRHIRPKKKNVLVGVARSPIANPNLNCAVDFYSARIYIGVPDLNKTKPFLTTANGTVTTRSREHYRPIRAHEFILLRKSNRGHSRAIIGAPGAFSHENVGVNPRGIYEPVKPNPTNERRRKYDPTRRRRCRFKLANSTRSSGNARRTFTRG